MCQACVVRVSGHGYGHALDTVILLENEMFMFHRIRLSFVLDAVCQFIEELTYSSFIRAGTGYNRLRLLEECSKNICSRFSLASLLFML